MFPKFSIRKNTQISEESSPPIHAPILIGNELFIVTQQDVRRIEEYRSFILNKLMPNGELKSLNCGDIDYLLLNIQQNSICNQGLIQLVYEILNKINNSTNLQTFNQICSQPMEIASVLSENRKVASIEQQLQWDKCVNTSTPFPMTYSCGTSTTELDKQHSLRKRRSLHTICSFCKYDNVHNKSTCTQDLIKNSKKSNETLSAREQLKQKKINYSLPI